MNKLKNFINNKWVESETEIYEQIYNPATEEILGKVPMSTAQDFEEAVNAAKSAYSKWSKTPVPQRARILFNYQNRLMANHEELARVIVRENGKSLSEARGEVNRGIECVEFAAGAPTLMMGRHLPDIATGIESAEYRYPLGVVGGISPFNFPMMVPCWMFPLAIAMGNTFILKPSEKTPLLANRLAELLMESGLPEGVLNIVHGGHQVVNSMLNHEEIKAVSFVGSQPVAKYVYTTASANLKRVQALSGAKNHTIVLNDAEMDLAVSNIIASAFGSAGERCMATSVVLVEEGVYDKFVSKISDACSHMKVGNGLNEDIFLGPVIRKENKQRTLDYIQSGLESGASLLRDGREHSITLESGYFLGPTIFGDVTMDMKIWKDEMFAPVLSLMKISSLDEGIEISNRSRYANGACLFTNNTAAVKKFRENIDAGMLGVNLGVPAPMAFFPFSGYKDSFYGDLHVNGMDGVRFYTRTKMVTSRY